MADRASGTGPGAAARRIPRGAGLVGTAVGAVAAGVAVGLAVERYTIGRAVRQMAQARDPGEAFGTLRGVPQTVMAADGVELYVEVDDPFGRPRSVDWKSVAGRPGPSANGSVPNGAALNGASTNVSTANGSADAQGHGAGAGMTGLAGLASRAAHAGRPCAAQRPTLLFTHGFCLPQDCWHYQRAEFSGEYRMVFWDQRGHGRSDPPPIGRELSIDVLGEDLYAVLEATCPTGPVILIGHSMGGMTMLALAERHPELFGGRIVGAALIGTSAGGFSDVAFGLPRAGARLLHRAAPGAFDLLAKQRGLVERGRKAGGDLGLVLTKRYAFGTNAPEAVVRFVQDLIQSTPIDVIAQFFPIFREHDKSGAVPVFDGVPTLVLAGGKDLLLPPEHSRALADAIPSAELLVLPEAGHVLILEQPDEVAAALRRLVDRAEKRLGASSDPPPRRAAR